MKSRFIIAAIALAAAFPSRAHEAAAAEPSAPAGKVVVSDSVRDYKLDYWASADTMFAHSVLGDVFKSIDYSVEHAPYCENGQFDSSKTEVICSAFRTPAILEEYDFPVQPLGTMHFALYTSPERASKMLSEKITEWPRLKVAYSPVAQGRTTDREDFFIHASLTPEYVEYHTSEEAVDALKRGDVDALFLYTPRGKRPGGIVEIVPIGDRNVYFAVRKDHPELLKKLSSAFRDYYIDHIDRIDKFRSDLLGIPTPTNRVRMAAYQRGDLFEVSPDGERSGVIAEWMKALSVYGRKEIDYVYGEYDESVDAVKSGRLDCIGGIGFAPIHREGLLFPHTPIGMLRVYLWAHPNGKYKSGDPMSWRGMKVGILSGTYSAARVKQQLESHDVDIVCREFHSDREMTDAYFAGELDACVDVEKPELAKELALHVYASHPMYICVSPKRPDLFGELEDALDDICDDLPRYMRMISDRRYGVKTGAATYSLKESDWLKKRIISREPVDIDLSPWPLELRDRNGALQGFPLKLLSELTKRSGLIFNVLPQSDLQTAEAKFLRGESNLWIPYPEMPKYAVSGAISIFSLSVPENFAEMVGAKELHSEYTLYAGPNAPEELLGVLRKTLASIDGNELQELFLDAVAENNTVHRVFGLTEEELERMLAVSGIALLSVILVYGFVMIILLKRHAKRAEISAQLAEDHAQAKTRFLAMMSHELRTPLNAVIGFAEFLGKPDVAESERKGYVDGILLSSNALLDLINDILDLSKLEAGAMDMRQGSCDMNLLLKDLPTIFGYNARKHGVALRVETAGGKPLPVVELSSQGMRQILINLVGNAAKFTDKGEISVFASWAGDTNTLHLEVSDTGCGISSERLEHIFNPFVQDVQTRMNSRAGMEMKGTGLGLSIVKRMVDSAKGEIQIESEIGKGTRLVIDIPGLKVLEDHENGSAAAAREVLKLAIPERVLVVDDMPMNRKILGIHLSNLGVKDIRHAENGKAALAVMDEWIPDLVLTDMWMPEMDGAKLAEEMHRDRRLAKVPVVAVTADVDAGSTYDMSLFAKVLSKPVTSDKLKTLF